MKKTKKSKTSIKHVISTDPSKNIGEKQSLRARLIGLVIEDFSLKKFFDQVEAGWKVEIEQKIKKNLAFDCEVINFEVIDTSLSGKISFKKENGDSSMIDFVISPVKCDLKNV